MAPRLAPSFFWGLSMQGLFTALSGLASLVNLACLIVVVIQLWKAKGPLHGILGVCCGLYSLIWGWQNVDTLDANNPPPLGLKYRQWLMIWSAAIGFNVLCSIIVQVMARS